MRVIAVDICQMGSWYKDWKSLSHRIHILSPREFKKSDFSKSELPLLILVHQERCIDLIHEKFVSYLKNSEKVFVLSVTGGSQNQKDIMELPRLHFSSRVVSSNTDLSSLSRDFETLCDSLQAASSISGIYEAWEVWDYNSLITNISETELISSLNHDYLVKIKNNVTAMLKGANCQADEERMQKVINLWSEAQDSLNELMKVIPQAQFDKIQYCIREVEAKINCIENSLTRSELINSIDKLFVSLKTRREA